MNLKDKRVLLKTPINPGTGYGRDGMLMARYLGSNFGADLHLEPKHVGIPLDKDIIYLFGKERPNHFDLAINHEYPGAMCFPEAMPTHADYIVGWTMFEFLSFGEDNEMAEGLRERLEGFDLVLAYDDVSASSLREYAPDPDRLKILQGGYDADSWKTTEEEKATRKWDDTFRFCMNGAMNVRKNPWIAIYAFKELKDEYGDKFDAELHLKTTSLVFPDVLMEWCPGLRIHYAYWSDADLRRFYLKMNCLVAPSWGEGKNLPALEAQTTGIPVAVSAFGGHMQWASKDWAYLMDGPIEEHAPGMGSIRVSKETMKETMWHIYNNRGEARQKGELASRIIPQQCDWEPVLDRLQDIIDTVPAKERKGQ